MDKFFGIENKTETIKSKFFMKLSGLLIINKRTSFH